MTDIVNPPTISSLPAAPLPTDTPTAFNTKSFALLGALDPMVTQINAVADATEQNATAANERAVSANSAKGAAESAASAANADALRLASLDALWLGAAASDPATGRGGAPLVAGNAYVNSGTGLLRTYNGTVWVNALNVTAGVNSVNGATGAVVLKTLGGQQLTGAGDIPLNTAQAITPAALDIDCNAGVYFTKTINANSTFTFSNPPAAGTAFVFLLELDHTSGTIAWPSSVRWPDNAAPTLTAGRTHSFVFVTDDGGARWRASVNPNYTT